ncbi:bifunctional helix-turn-helix transcriptional regulator/GNAT family N-acetyltransferase [Shumkonia mesophila]|uniref:bifunctional helix-turn-helix transcriptional regulator/GNAT family N-acetyltransferase n=1 Tax=Shumkonia mesophila TaxID=2838854 RepID=UPI0029345EB5|nr:helix-turn-helix domain-containing GNAT family N-acetyltransferase [Shumkonia mesophila]
MAASVAEGQVAAVRRFNRFYTQRIGVLEEGLLNSAFSLTEARVLYELANRENPAAADLCRDLGFDAGYLSRILGRLVRRGLLTKSAGQTDGRRRRLALTEAGRAAFATLDGASRQQVAALLGGLSPAGRERLLAAMASVARLLGGQPAGAVSYILRPPRSGDLGRVVSRHGALYAGEYGWDESFEVLVAGIVADFAKNQDPKRERCWIAEVDGEAIGAVFLVRQSDEVAKLRLLYVEPEARGLGIGARLVEEAVRFARQAGYATLTLWTNDILTAARRLYEAAGFRLIREEPHHSFGHDLVGQYWELGLVSH